MRASVSMLIPHRNAFDKGIGILHPRYPFMTLVLRAIAARASRPATPTAEQGCHYHATARARSPVYCRGIGSFLRIPVARELLFPLRTAMHATGILKQRSRSTSHWRHSMRKSSLGISWFFTFTLVILLLSQSAFGDERAGRPYIVVLKAGTSSSPAVAADHARRYGVQVSHIYEHALKGYAAVIPAARLEFVRNDPNVEFLS